MFRLWALCGRYLVCGIDGVSEVLVIWTTAINRATFVILWNHRLFSLLSLSMVEAHETVEALEKGKYGLDELCSVLISVKAKWFCATLYCLFSQVKLVLITKHLICIVVNALRLLDTSVMSCMVLVCASWWDLSPSACLLYESSGWMKASSINTKLRILPQHHPFLIQWLTPNSSHNVV